MLRVADRTAEPQRTTVRQGQPPASGWGRRPGAGCAGACLSATIGGEIGDPAPRAPVGRHGDLMNPGNKPPSFGSAATTITIDEAATVTTDPEDDAIQTVTVTGTATCAPGVDAILIHTATLQEVDYNDGASGAIDSPVSFECVNGTAAISLTLHKFDSRPAQKFEPGAQYKFHAAWEEQPRTMAGRAVTEAYVLIEAPQE